MLKAAQTDIVTAPDVEPLSLAEVKTNLVVDHADTDVLLTSLISRARVYAEKQLHRSLIQQIWDCSFVRWPFWSGDGLALPAPPLIEVQSVKYYDASKVQQTLASSVYEVVGTDPSPYLALAYNQSWPDLYPLRHPITIRIATGYGTSANDVPENIRQAMQLMIGHWYENREASTPLKNTTIEHGWDSLLSLDRLIKV